jgi:hypothetical protein
MQAANDNRRLLTKSQAATYCGLSVATFDVVCPVRPIALGEGARMRRYDVQKIDKWVDGLQGDGQSISPTDEAIAARKARRMARASS